MHAMTQLDFNMYWVWISFTICLSLTAERELTIENVLKALSNREKFVSDTICQRGFCS